MVGFHYFLPGLRLHSQPHSITAPWPVPSYTAWRQKHIRVNNLPKVVIQLLPRVGFEPTTCWSQVQHSTRCTTAPPTCKPIKCKFYVAKFSQNLVDKSWPCDRKRLLSKNQCISQILIISSQKPKMFFFMIESLNAARDVPQFVNENCTPSNGILLPTNDIRLKHWPQHGQQLTAEHHLHKERQFVKRRRDISASLTVIRHVTSWQCTNCRAWNSSRSAWKTKRRRLAELIGGSVRCRVMSGLSGRWWNAVRLSKVLVSFLQHE